MAAFCIVQAHIPRDALSLYVPKGDARRRSCDGPRWTPDHNRVSPL